MKEKLKLKVKSYSFWTGLSAAVIILVKSIADIFGKAVNETLINDLIMGICGVLVVMGIVVMPTEDTKKDNKEDNTTQNNE